MMLHTKYQDSRPYGFRREDFSCFPYITLCKICDPRGGVIFGHREGHHLNKLSKGPLGDATYQISKL